ncbi:MAG: ABC transporter substrate-binding protein [Gammaproteobacteria bacterium]|nr:ABC transporter substrate-binding protein [Gammaproteobacteria bacterium]
MPGHCPTRAAWLPAALLALALVMPAAARSAQPLPTVVSLDYCADQYVLALADREQILAISTGPDDEFSAMRQHAAGVPQVRDISEDVLALEPDMVIRLSGGGPRALDFYRRVGIKTHQLHFPGDFAGVRETIRDAAAALGHPARGEALITEMDAVLQAAAGEDGAPRMRALYVTPSGVTTGSDTMVHEILEAGGFDNAAAGNGMRGWFSLPLEDLVVTPPDLIVTGFFGMRSTHVDHWTASRHPVLRDLFERTPTVHLDGALLACGAWFMADAALSARQQANRLAVKSAALNP